MISGVAVRDLRLFDRTYADPEYKAGLVKAIHDVVSTGDHVELVGFGMGMSTVHLLDVGAARVIAYEGAEEMIEIGTHTLKINRTGNGDVDVRHSIVGEPVDIWGTMTEANSISPSELSTADVLVLDCEGAEVNVLRNLGTFPDAIICETHPKHGAPTEVVTAVLDSQYELSVREYEPDAIDGKNVVVASRH